MRKALIGASATMIDFLEKTVDPGFAIVHNLPKPASQAVEDVGLPMEKYVQDVVARINRL